MISKLFEPVNIGKLRLKNRVVMAPMVVLLGSDTGAVSQRQIDYFVERARHGVGLITVEPGCVTSGANWGWGGQYINSDRFLPMYNELVESIHLFGDGCKVSIQLHSPGRQANLEMSGDEQPVSASAIEGTTPDVTTRPLEIEEIEQFVEAFADGAGRAKTAGFDAVNIEGACGYLINQFLSPLYNKRTDEYGGSLENRLRFAVRIVRRIKERLGEDFPVIFELPCDEFTEGGITLPEAKLMAQKLEEAGVDAFRTHKGSYEAYRYIIPPACLPRGCYVHFAEEIKGAVKKAKVQVEGRIIEPALAEEILQANKADLIGLGRALIADSQWPQKARNGRIDDIRQCLGCNRCIERIFKSFPAKCTVNAALGKEDEYRLVPVKNSKKVVVVGGGPAGMEAARVTSLRGHRVTLFEKEDRLGGQLNLACVAPFKEEMGHIIKYLTHQITKQGVEVRLGEEATLSKVKEQEPDVVVVAAGATPLVPKIPGVDRKNVLLAWDVLSNNPLVGNKIMVVGGGLVGCETAEYLASKGKNVIILEMLPDIAQDIEPYTRSFLLERLDKYGVTILTSTKLIEITNNGIVCSKNSSIKTIEADTVVLALGSVSNRDLIAEIKGKVSELYTIGDCEEPEKLLEAIHAGFHAGRLI